MTAQNRDFRTGTNLYDVGQALSWVATNRNNAEEKTRWQTEIPNLLEDLVSAAA
jgi:hypothetical protein